MIGAARVHDRSELARSLEVSLGILLSVRAPARVRGRPAAERTVIDYGIVEIEAFSPTNRDDLRILGDEITEAIRAFEPRLEEPQVITATDPEDGKRVTITVSGLMRMGALLEPFEFRTPLGGTPG